MSKRVYEPLHYAISVNDMDSTIKWFEEMLNFKLISKSEMTLWDLELDLWIMEQDLSWKFLNHLNQNRCQRRGYVQILIIGYGNKHLAFKWMI